MPEATFYVGMAESIPLPGNSVDLVFSTLSFHHWSDQMKGLREIVRVLRPGGPVLPCRYGLPEIFSPWSAQKPG